MVQPTQAFIYMSCGSHQPLYPRVGSHYLAPVVRESDSVKQPVGHSLTVEFVSIFII